MFNHALPIQKLFGLSIKKHRQQLGLSQESFADKCGLHRTYIGCIERGEKNITIVNIEKIAEALNLPISKIFIDIEKN